MSAVNHVVLDARNQLVGVAGVFPDIDWELASSTLRFLTTSKCPMFNRTKFGLINDKFEDQRHIFNGRDLAGVTIACHVLASIITRICSQLLCDGLMQFQVESNITS